MAVQLPVVVPSLAARLRSETHDLHRDAERSPFMAALLKGRVDAAGYAALLVNLRAIYAGLEAALSRHAGVPALGTVDWPAYRRRGALDRDIATFGADGARAALLPTTRRYIDRLATLSESRPDLLLAHGYVRYLGDLSGGQLLRRIVSGSARLGPDVGTTFYDFGDDARVTALAAAFRDGLDRAGLDDPGAVVAEARAAFVLHRDLFDELADAHGIAASPRSAD